MLRPWIWYSRENKIRGGGGFTKFIRREHLRLVRVMSGCETPLDANPEPALVAGFSFAKLVMNLKSAKSIGLTVPPSLLARADEVIQ